MCSVSGCEKATLARGLCSKHYNRLIRHGSEDIVLNTKGMTLNKKLEFYTNKTGGCWYWFGDKNHCGYGTIRYGGRMAMAHRLAWINRFGDIPDGMLVLHKCDNRKCVNPEHLFIGTQEDNMKDMKSKGRGRKPAAFYEGDSK